MYIPQFLNLILQQTNAVGVANLSQWSYEICSHCWSAPIILWKISLTREGWISGWRSWLASLILRLVFDSHSSHVVMCVLIHQRPKDSCGWSAARRRRLDLQERFPKKHACPKYLAAPFLRLGIPRERLSIPARILKRWEKRKLTGNVGLSTAYWFSILKISRVIHTVDFIL